MTDKQYKNRDAAFEAYDKGMKCLTKPRDHNGIMTLTREAFNAGWRAHKDAMYAGIVERAQASRSAPIKLFPNQPVEPCDVDKT
jgi:hypothetical protein